MTQTSDPAQARAAYEQSMRRPRLVYAAVLTVIAAVFATIFVVVWANGSAAHTTLHTVRRGPAAVALGAASATQTRAWTTTDRAADGQPQWRGTVVTYSAHTMRGRDARTGAQTWSYTRSDRTICAVGQAGGVAIAIFRRDGDCDEVDALNADTGARAWSRTLDEDGAPVNGTPQFQFTASTFLVTTPQVIYAIIPVGFNQGVDQLKYDRYGCTISHAVAGSSGVLISQTCDSRVQCTGQKFCGRGRQLLLDPINGRAGNAPSDNTEQLLWNDLGNADVPVSADEVTAALHSGTLNVLNAKNGRVTGRLRLNPAPDSTAGATATATDSSELIWSGGHLYAVEADGADVSWTAAASTSPTILVSASTSAAQRITAVTGSSVTFLDPDTGRVSGRSQLPTAAPSGSVAYPLGNGFLVASDNGTVVYR